MKIFRFVTILLISGCSISPKPGLPTKTPILLPGFTLISSPNSLDKTGTIIAVDKKGISQTLGSINIIPEIGIINPGEASGKRVSSVSALLNFLGTNKSSVDINTNAKFDKQFDYQISLKDCSIERIELLKINAELDKTKELIRKFSASNDMSNYKYYLISEAIKSKKLTYKFGDSKVGDIDLKANINKVIDVNPSVKWDNVSNLELSYELAEPLYVYVKYWTLNVQSQVTGESIFEIGKEVTNNDPIYGEVK